MSDAVRSAPVSNYLAAAPVAGNSASTRTAGHQHGHHDSRDAGGDTTPNGASRIVTAYRAVNHDLPDISDDAVARLAAAVGHGAHRRDVVGEYRDIAKLASGASDRAKVRLARAALARNADPAAVTAAEQAVTSALPKGATADASATAILAAHAIRHGSDPATIAATFASIRASDSSLTDAQVARLAAAAGDGPDAVTRAQAAVSSLGNAAAGSKTQLDPGVQTRLAVSMLRTGATAEQELGAFSTLGTALGTASPAAVAQLAAAQLRTASDTDAVVAAYHGIEGQAPGAGDLATAQMASYQLSRHARAHAKGGPSNDVAAPPPPPVT